MSGTKIAHTAGQACDLAQNRILVSVNGRFNRQNGAGGLEFQRTDQQVSDLYPAFTGHMGRVLVNFAEDGRFNYPPPEG